MYEKTINTQYHNWSIHDIYVKSLLKYTKYFSGTVLDIGCGKKPYKKIIIEQVENYFGIEHTKTFHGFSEVDIAGSALNLPVKNSVVDVVVSFQVLEHIPEPEVFLSEVYRVLKPGGKCLLMTPFMWGEHEEPYDYFRYTRYGLEYLSKKTGFDIIKITADTGVWTTIIIRINYFLMQFSNPITKYFIIPFVWLNQFFAKKMDHWFDSNRTFTSNFTTLLEKKL